METTFERIESAKDEESVRERLWIERSTFYREVRAGRFSGISTFPLSFTPLPIRETLRSAWDATELKGAIPTYEIGRSELRIVDLFSGGGGFGLGATQAAAAVGLRPTILLAADTDEDALSVYENNLRPLNSLRENLWSQVEFQVLQELSGSVNYLQQPLLLAPVLRSLVGYVDLLIGGPPCEGHSNSNNSTRRNDPRNLLYLVPLAIGTTLRARLIVIENVPQVVRDHGRVTEIARRLAINAGYQVDELAVSALDLGVPQTRKRHLFIASRDSKPEIESALASMKLAKRDVRFAIGDLVEVPRQEPYDRFAELSVENWRRVHYLHDKDKYDLPNRVRPDCHKAGTTYKAVYGRLRWDQPSGTITTGFLSPGRGRYVHPSERRGLTPHEAARLQGFPDWYDFDLKVERKRANNSKRYSKLIGDAVPPQMGFFATLVALSTLNSQST